MRIRKIHELNDEHFAVVEMRDEDVFIWIAQDVPAIFGLINIVQRVSPVTLYVMTDDREEHGKTCCSITTSIAGRIMTLGRKLMHIDQFDIKSAISTVYSEYLRSDAWKNDFNRKLRDISKQI